MVDLAKPVGDLAGGEDVLGDRQIAEQVELLEHHADATRSRASPDDANETSSPSSRMRPCVGFSTPAMIFISVDLPAPFSPTSTLTAPLAHLEIRTLDCDGAGIDLRHVLQLQDDIVLGRRAHGFGPISASAGVSSGRSGRCASA